MNNINDVLPSADFDANQMREEEGSRLEQEGHELLRPYNISEAYWRRSIIFIIGKKKVVGMAVGRLGRAGLANRDNLTRLIGLEERQCEELCRAVHCLALGAITLNQQIFEFLYERRENRWGNRISRLYGHLGDYNIFSHQETPGILGETFDTLMAPENREYAESIAEGWLLLHSRELFDRCRDRLVAVQGDAASLGRALSVVQGLRGYEWRHNEFIPRFPARETLERCIEALLQYPEHAATLALGFSELQRRGLLTQDSPIFEVDPRFADEVALGLDWLNGSENLRGNEDCIAALISGDPKGEHAKKITDGVILIGSTVTLDQFRGIVEALPASNPFNPDTGLK